MLKQFLLSSALGLALAFGGAPAAAQPATPVLAPVVAQLEAEGYVVIDTRLSWFGRLVVTSTRDGVLREVVLNRTTGAVLSDRLFDRPEAATASGTQAGPATAPRNGVGTGSDTNGAGGNGSH